MNTKFDNIMIDIETLGAKPGSVICSIAAVEFNIETGQTGRRFFRNINIQSCLDAGLYVDGSTIYWWLNQSDSARSRFQLEKIEFLQALTQFSHFINASEKDVKVWGNSARFDLGILEAAYNKAYSPIPWVAKNERDVRTLVSFAPYIKKNEPFVGVKHDPIDDCLHQIKYCHKIWNLLVPNVTTI